MTVSPIEFTRGLDEDRQRCGNYVRIEDATGGSPLAEIETLLSAQELTHVSNTAAALGDNELVAAPAAGHRIVVVNFVIQNETGTATTMILSDGADDCYRCLGQNQGDGLAMVFARGHEWRLTAATALNLNLSGANQCGYSVAYFVETV